MRRTAVLMVFAVLMIFSSAVYAGENKIEKRVELPPKKTALSVAVESFVRGIVIKSRESKEVSVYIAPFTLKLTVSF